MIYLVLDRPYTCMPFSKYKGKKKTEVDGDEAIPCWLAKDPPIKPRLEMQIMLHKEEEDWSTWIFRSMQWFYALSACFSELYP